MCQTLSFSIDPLPWIAAVAVLVVVAGNLDFGFFSIFLTSSILILSAAFLTLSRPKPVIMVEESTEEEEEEEGCPQEEEVVSESKQQQLQSEAVAQKTHAKEEEEVVSEQRGAQKAQTDGHSIRSPQDLLWESESHDRSSTSADSEVGWPFREGAGGHSSDGSISDEESLIEIAIPSGHYVVPKGGGGGGGEEEEAEEEAEAEAGEAAAKFIPREQKRWGGLSYGALFEQHNLMELLSEMNEEENLIEIDISMGSIKCSRVKMEA